MINAVMMLMLWGQIGEEFYWAERMRIQVTNSFDPGRYCVRVWGHSNSKFETEWYPCGK